MIWLVLKDSKGISNVKSAAILVAYAKKLFDQGSVKRKNTLITVLTIQFSSS